MGTIASNAREMKLAQHYNTLSDDFKIERPAVSDHYADFLITNNLTGESSWLEDKASMGDRLLNTGAKYKNGSWSFNGLENAFTKQITPLLNKAAQSFIEEFDVVEFDGNRDQLFVDLLTAQLNGRNVKICDKIHIENLGELIGDYYNTSKAEPCHYIQMGDNFYLLGDTNPLGLNENVPTLKGEGYFSLRFCINNHKMKDGSRKPMSVRTKPEVNFTKSGKNLIESEYSLMEGTTKLNPFKA